MAATVCMDVTAGSNVVEVPPRRLTARIHSYGLAPPTQFGGRPGSSTVDAALTLVNDIEAARNHGMVASRLTFDIKGYFDFVNRAKVASTLRQKNLPISTVKWVIFPIRTQAAICLDGKLSSSNPVTNGIPQGSPISPALSIVYASALYKEFQQKLSTRTIPLGLPAEGLAMRGPMYPCCTPPQNRLSQGPKIQPMLRMWVRPVWKELQRIPKRYRDQR